MTSSDPALKRAREVVPLDAQGEGPGAGAPQGGAQEFSQDDLQQAMMAGENLRMQLAQIDEQQNYVTQLLQDTQRSREALEALDELGEGEEMLFPLGAGNFVRAKVTDAGKVLTNLGSGIHMEAGAKVALERLKDREESLGKTQNRLNEEAQRLSTQLQQVNALLQQFQGGP